VVDRVWVAAAHAYTVSPNGGSDAYSHMHRGIVPRVASSFRMRDGARRDAAVAIDSGGSAGHS